MRSVLYCVLWLLVVRKIFDVSEEFKASIFKKDIQIGSSNQVSKYRKVDVNRSFVVEGNGIYTRNVDSTAHIDTVEA
jgi:hypothetical protein